MPRLAGLLTRGRLVPMTASLPEISAVSWSSFMTGTQPGRHGIFGFVDLQAHSYQYRFPDFRDLRAPPFFDELGLQGRRTVAVNLPATYPARPIPGALVSGFVALDLERAVWPAAYLPLLRRMGYQVDVETGKARDRLPEFLADLHVSLRTRRDAAEVLWENESWDVFLFVVTESDRLYHFLFDAGDPRHPLHGEFLELHREIDRTIGVLLDRAAEAGDHEVMLLSDHGFCPLQREIYLNPILKKHGFLVMDGAATPASLSAIGRRATAFALDPSRVYLHRRGRFFRGSLGARDLRVVAGELRDLFASLRDDGRPVIRRVFMAEEIYEGPCLADAPDLVLLAEPGFDLKAGLEKTAETGRQHFTGMHQWDNAMFFRTGPGEIPAPMAIEKVKGEIFRLLGA